MNWLALSCTSLGNPLTHSSACQRTLRMSLMGLRAGW
ncbi:hypothetical protein E2C01_081305 [Portunus trituberculatus]|uniref:Uncharacterized protein n=1 Tax=Portunus trituberculatus TaxID=210409 RepID=A0A5B7IVG6_PORTR|nr:hypothetical protein [Portunus trituberculatus]